MTEEPKSTDYHSVTPYLLVPGVSDLAAFVAEAYGAEEKLRLNRSDGSIMHIETRIGDSIIMMGEPMQDLGAMPASLYLSVEDCDAVYEKALASGAKSIMEPTDMTHAGERYGGVLDPWGNLWWIATHIEDLSAEEQAGRIESGQVPDVDLSA